MLRGPLFGHHRHLCCAASLMMKTNRNIFINQQSSFTPACSTLLSCAIRRASIFSSSQTLFDKNTIPPENVKIVTPPDETTASTTTQPITPPNPRAVSTSFEEPTAEQQAAAAFDDQTQRVNFDNSTETKPSVLISTVDPFENMPRFPQFTSVMGCLRGLDYVGTTAFAISGSMLAASYGLNFFGCTCVGVTTALGGGAIRDMVFSSGVAFIDEYEYLYVAIAAAAMTFLVCLWYTPSAKHLADYDQAMFWLDSIGLGAFCVIATLYGSKRNLPFILILLNTVLCCTGGGVVRDLMVRRPIRILNNYAEAYAETVIAGCTMYCALKKMKVPTAYRAIAGWLTVIIGRVWVTTYNYSLPQACAFRQKYPAPNYEEKKPEPLK